MDLTKEDINISVSTWETAPDWVITVIERERKEKNKLIHIDGYSMSKPDGEIEYEVYSFCFASAFVNMRIYKIVKYTTHENPYLYYVWVNMDELKTYLEAMKEVDFSEFYENNNS